jgi:hypothetical protein
LSKENAEELNPCRTLSRASGPGGLDRVRQAAKGDKQLRFTALLHHVNIDRLRGSYYNLKRGAAAGVDGVTWQEYGDGLEERLADLQGRIHRGAYQAKPSRRVWIPKADGRQRPLGIAALEDKIVQSAVVQVLNPIWEEDFLDFSYGFRPGRSQHDALDALYVGITSKKVNYVLDLDIRSFFDKVGHDHLEKFIRHRIGDERLVRLILKWLKAGVMEDGQWFESKEGTPQGAVMTPRTQKITSNLSGGYGSGKSRVRIDVCRYGLYVYDRCRVPTMFRRPSASIAHGSCFGTSTNFPMLSSGWRRTVPFRRVKPIATSNKLSN